MNQIDYVFIKVQFLDNPTTSNELLASFSSIAKYLECYSVATS